MVAASGGEPGRPTSRLRESSPVDRRRGLSVRSVNSLKNSNIRTLGDLVQYARRPAKVKNVGEKALGEIAECSPGGLNSG